MFSIKSRRVLVLIFAGLIQVSCQLPDDIQRELNQNLAEQARIQAMRQRHQQQIQSRVGQQQKSQSATPSKSHDPNNYSYQQVSPPIQYSYYQPYGDAAQPAASPQANSNQRSSPQAAQNPANFDLNNLNFDLPQPQAQVAAQRPEARQQQYTPSFSGAGGLPALNPIPPTGAGYAPPGVAPLAPQARVQQGPPLSEADFKDITGGENYGAPGSSDFGLGGASSGGNSANRRAGSDTDEQLREFGMPMEQPASASRRAQSAAPMGVPDFGAFGSLTDSSPNQNQNAPKRADPDGFGNLDLGNLGGDRAQGGAPTSNSDFDFAGEPSSARADQTAGASGGGAPGSLQSLLGASFPGLGGGGADGFARGSNNPQQQRQDDGSLNIAELGDKSDQFSGADLGGFEQPSPQADQDFNYAASNQQPSSVPYADSNPQPVGSLWALTQPQSLSQTRYNPLPDKGSYQDYPAYQSGGHTASSVSEVVNSTPAARRAGPGRYGTPSSEALASEHRTSSFDYARAPNLSSAESNNDLEDDDEDFE